MKEIVRNEKRWRRRTSWFRLTMAGIVVLAAVRGRAHSGPGPAPAYSIQDLGSFGGVDTRASAINASGQVVGYSYTAAGCLLHAFRFSGGSGLEDLGALPGGGGCSFATGINNRGQVVGNADHHPGSGDYTAFRFTDGIGIVDLGTLPGDAGSSGQGINGSGEVVGESGAPDGTTRAFRFSDGAGMQDLGGLGGSRSSALAINAQGQVVGSARTASTPLNDYWNPGHAFVYTDDAGLRDLNDLVDPASGWELRKATAINNRGQIVGYGYRNAAITAFRYTRGAVRDLGTFPGGGISYALGMNNHGDVVGAAYLDASGVGNFRAFVSTDFAGMRNLNDLIDPSTGWVLREATDINETGQIVGWGERGGEIRAFRLDPVD